MPSVTVDNISKAYRIGIQEKHEGGLKAAVGGLLKEPGKRLRRFSEDWDAEDTHWALRDVNFTLEPGEVVGFIGRNGAGKSTLLKVLSRITEPTGGRAVMKGRVSSLLEVGTGFHPELTGRENVYLNGAILGMPRKEIAAKFDQIVEFSEVGKFLDTPVKRYSSGMYVRLAFAVAAHLDPQILIVDEVLAVGDAAFQKKCIGKMSDVAKGGGRTILFVSHQMDAVAGLCDSVFVVDGGRVSEKLPVHEGIERYLGTTGSAGSGLPLAELPRTQDRPRPPIFTDLKMIVDGKPTSVIPTGDAARFEITMNDFDDAGNITAALAVVNHRNQRVILLHSEYHSGLVFRGEKHKVLFVEVPSLPLTPGTYQLQLVCADGFKELERVERAGEIEVVFQDTLGTGKLPNHQQSNLVLPATWSAA
jgi:lipopolysaccharide transport system ATP-binding protein